MNPCENCREPKEVREMICAGDHLHNAWEDFKQSFFESLPFLGVKYEPDYQCRVVERPDLYPDLVGEGGQDER